jgi:hypothetical protein
MAKVRKHIASIYYVMIVGPIGSGKSVNATALTQMTEASKINDMEEKIYKTITLLNDYVDFSLFDDYIFQSLNTNEVYTDESYRFFVYKYFKTYSRIYHLQDIMRFESFRHVRVWDLLAEYVEIMYYLHFRKIHVMSNITIESVNTGYNSISIKESLFQLYRKNDLASEKYLVIVEDEKGVVDNARVYARLDKNSVQDNDDGKDINEMIQRHGSKGTNTKFVVAQTEKDVTANRRRLPNRFVELLQPQDAYIFNLEIMFLNYLIDRNKRKEYKTYKKKMRKVKRLSFLYRIRKKQKYIDKAEEIYLKYGNYLDVFNKYKKRIKRYIRFNNFLGRHLYKIQHMFLHESEERIGKRGETETVVTHSFPITMVYPADITYERYDQYSFYDIYNERNKSATVTLAKHGPFKHKIMNKEEHRKMNYRAINRIFDEVESQHSDYNTTKKETSNTENNTVYDVYE